MAHGNREKPTSILLKAIFENGAGSGKLPDAVTHTTIAQRVDEVARLHFGSVVIDVTFSSVDAARQG